MPDSSPSITQLTSLVEELTRLVAGLLPPDATREGDDPCPGLAARLGRFWPQSARWRGPLVSREAARALVRQRRQARDQLTRELQAREQAREVGQAEHLARIEGLARDLSHAQAALERARQNLDQLTRAGGEALAKAKQQRAKAQELARWLEGITPKGIKKFTAPDGQVLELADIQAKKERLAALWAQVRQAEQTVTGYSGRQQKARVQVETAQALVGRRQKALEQGKAQRGLAAGDGRDLERIGAALAQTQAGLDQAQRLRVVLDQLVQGFARHLEPRLQIELPALRHELGGHTDQALAQAEGLARRLARLEGVMGRAQHLLAQRGQQAQEALKALREINAEIAREEQRFTAIIEPLTEQDIITPPVRAQAAAQLATLHFRLEALTPKARAAQAEFAHRQAALETQVEKAKSLVEEYKESGRAERSALDQAEALGIETRQVSQELIRHRDGLVATLQPLVRVLDGVRPVDLAPLLDKACKRLENISAALDEHTLSREDAQARRFAPSVDNLAKSPLAVKPQAKVLRRMSGRRVEVAQLEALAAAAAQWRQMAQGPLARALARPAELVALNMAGGLARLAGERNRQERRLLGLERDLVAQTREAELRQKQVRRLQQRQQELESESTRLHQRLADLRHQYQTQSQRDQARILGLENQASLLQNRLAHGQRLAQALKAKHLDTFRLARRQAGQLTQVQGERDRLAQRSRELERVRLTQAQRLEDLGRQLAQVQQEAQAWAKAAEELEATAARAQAQAQQAEAQAQQARTEAQGAREEARLAREEANQQNHALHELQAETRLQVPADAVDLDTLRALRVQVAELQELNQSLALAITMLGRGGQAFAARHLEWAVGRLAEAKKGLKAVGRSPWAQRLVMGTLTGSLVLLGPQTTLKATLSDKPLKAPLSAIHRVDQSLDLAPSLDLRVEVGRTPTPGGGASVALDLLRLGRGQTLLSGAVKEQLRDLARQSGVAERVLITSVPGYFGGLPAVEPGQLTDLARTARLVSQNHPLIFGELSVEGLPPEARSLAHLPREPERGRKLFIDRMYREYRSLGLSSQTALEAVIQNEKAATSRVRQWTIPKFFTGKVQPMPEVEAMNLTDFLERISPFVADRCEVFLRAQGVQRHNFAGTFDVYAKNMAFDMYCAAKKFDVPVSFLLAIAHQETYYANILGDSNLSESPFQIYKPTRSLIRDDMSEAGLVPPPVGMQLRNHLTMATYMAAFHLRDLMQRAYHPAHGNQPAAVDMDRVMKAYNGSEIYAGRVASRQKELARFLAGEMVAGEVGELPKIVQ